MTEIEKLHALKAMTGEENEELLFTYLAIAGNKIIRRAYPFGDGTEDVPAKYEYVQLEIAVYLLNKRGAEGETAHSENGISRTYSGGDVPLELLREVVPMAIVVRGGSQ